MGKLDDMKEHALYALLYDKLKRIEENLNRLLRDESTAADSTFETMRELENVKELFNVHK